MPTLRLNSRGPDVSDWQRFLVRRGYTLHVDGHFGVHTEAATKAFQRSAGLLADGIVGPQTRAAAEASESTREVPRVRTPLSEVDLADVLQAGHVAALGSEPSKERLGVAWAQMALEHGRGKYVYCNNIGNITAGGWSGPYYVIRVQERVNKATNEWKWMDLKFRVHRTPEDGAADFWRLLAGRYASALPLFDAGDAVGAAMRLGALNYYTAHEEQYARGMAGLYREWMGR
jgi:hypothetical protein